jgi:hypothetical protein
MTFATALQWAWGGSGRTATLSYWFRINVVHVQMPTTIAISTLKRVGTYTRTAVRGYVTGMKLGHVKVSLRYSGHVWQSHNCPTFTDGNFSCPFTTQRTPGTIQVKVSYSGDADHKPAASKVATIRVH